MVAGATTTAAEEQLGARRRKRVVGLEPLAGGGEELCTWGRKALPPRVFTILEPEKEKKGGGGLQKMETGCEMKKERKKGLYIGRGGGGG